MDKLKEHGYMIAVGATALVLLTLMYFMVIAPLGDLRAARADVEQTAATLMNAAKRKPKGFPEPVPPSALYLKHLTDESATAAGVKLRGVEKYTEISRRFKLYFDDAVEAPAAPDFAARYRDDLDKLINAYREKFGIKVATAGEPGEDAPPPDKDDKGGPAPRVDRRDEQAIEATVLPSIMREFWMIETVIKACQELEIGGLKAISFAGLQAAVRDAAREASPVSSLSEVTVSLEMPFSRLEDLVTRLFSSERVLFQLQYCEVKRGLDTVKALAPLAIEKQYKDTIDAKKETYPLSEPVALIELRLAAFEFNGLPVVAEPKQ